MAGKPKRKRRIPRRDRLGTPRAAQTNLESISTVQALSRKQRKRGKRQSRRTQEKLLPLIEDITKSEQAWLNELRRVKRPEDLDDFD